jgi:excisionase family DNA binding protein
MILTVPELAKELRVNPSTVYDLAKRGKIPSFRIGAAWRFDLEEVLARLKNPPTPHNRRSTIDLLYPRRPHSKPTDTFPWKGCRSLADVPTGAADISSP